MVSSEAAGTAGDAIIGVPASPVCQDGLRRDDREEEGDPRPVSLPLLPEAGNNSL
jgi:hypothetical protein